MDGNGNYVIAWEGDVGGYSEIFLRRFSPDGTPLSAPIQVSGTSPANKSWPAIAMNDAGQIAVTWSRDGGAVFLRLFDSGGQANTDEFRVSDDLGDSAPSVAIDPAGNPVVVWESQNFADQDLVARRFSFAGDSISDELLVASSIDSSTPSTRRVAVNSEGDFAVVWLGQELEVQYYSKYGVPVGDPFVAGDRSSLSGSILYPQAALGLNGRLLIANNWTTVPDFDQDVTARLIAAPTLEQGALQSGETTVNSELAGMQLTSGESGGRSVATDSSGNFVVTWASENQDGDGYGIYGQRFSSTGAALDGEFQVNSEKDFDQIEPAIAMSGDGKFVVAWSSFGQDGDDEGIFAQRFDASGNPIGAEFQVNSSVAYRQYRPAVGIDDSGSFVITWMSEQGGLSLGIFARRFDESGNPIGSEFQVDDGTDNLARDPSIAMNGGGDFFVTWTGADNGGGSSAFGVFGRKFEPNGVASTEQFVVNSDTFGTQRRQSVAMNDNGTAVVVWMTDSGGVSGRLFDANGLPVGDDFLVATPFDPTLSNPDVAMSADGSFVATWNAMNAPSGESRDVFARRFDSNANPIGDQFLVNTRTDSDQVGQSVAIQPDGDFVIAWSSFGPTYYGVSVKQFQLEDGLIDSATVTLANNLDGDAESLAVDTLSTGIQASYAGGILTFSGTASATVYEEVLKTIRYENSEVNATVGSREIGFVVNRGFLVSETATLQLTLFKPGELNWQGDVSDDWSEPENWLEGRVPQDGR